MSTPSKIGVIDCETDPFRNGRIPKPFCCEFYSAEHCKVTWGPNCIAEMCEWLEKLETPYLIFAHNGGKFDFHFFADYIDNPIKIIKARIVSAKLFHHTVRDSFAIIPVPLGAYQKQKFDYSKLEAHCREKHKREILEYLHSDCVNLFEIAFGFVERFGPRLTVGQTAMRELKDRHEFEIMQPEQDAYFRQFYYGGRVQCFQSGVLQGPWQMYDVNSMYPKAMRDFDHPHNGNFDIIEGEFPAAGETYFMRFRGRNDNALPVKTPEGLSFNVERGEFFACSHEIEAALELGLIEIEEILECAVALETTRFETFVDDFYEQKVTCKKAGDKQGEMFAKFMLNSAYGKFGQNPDNFEEWKIVRDYGNDEALEVAGYSIRAEYPTFELWSKKPPVRASAFYDVSIAASITSAARSLMMRGIAQAVDPVYCDTDSLICREFKGEVSGTILGAWKHEGQADVAAVAGKKMYALYNHRSKEPIKVVSKGGNLTKRDIVDMCGGKTIHYRNDAPTFSLSRETTFVNRTFRKTVDMTAKTGL